MASNNISSASPGSAFFSLEIVLPGQQDTSVGGIVALMRAQFDESVYAPSTSAISLTTSSTDYVAKTLRQASVNGTPLAKLRLGLGATDKIAWIPWQTHLITGFEAVSTGIGTSTGYDITLMTGDALHVINRAVHTTSFRGPISDVVQTIAARNNISNTVIEPTSDTGLWIQSFQGDADFIRRRLVARARSTRRRGDYRFYVQDGALHFHSVGYSARIVNLNYDSSARVSLALVDLSQSQLKSGASGVNMIGYDPSTATATTLKSVPDDATRLGNVIPQLASVPGGVRTMRMHFSDNGPAELPTVGQNAYESARAGCFQLNLTLDKTALLRAGDILQVNLTANTTKTSCWGGAYLVAACRHTYNNGSLRSMYTLQRGEMNLAKTSSTGILDDVTAPGFDLNVQDTQSSLLTRSSGQGLGGTFLTVQDPTGPVVA